MAGSEHAAASAGRTGSVSLWNEENTSRMLKKQILLLLFINIILLLCCSWQAAVFQYIAVYNNLMYFIVSEILPMVLHHLLAAVLRSQWKCNLCFTVCIHFIYIFFDILIKPGGLVLGVSNSFSSFGVTIVSHCLNFPYILPNRQSSWNEHKPNLSQVNFILTFTHPKNGV